MVIVDSGGGNIRSIENCLLRLGQKSILSKDKNIIAKSKTVILPGVGNGSHCMSRLRELDLIETLKNHTGQVLGICAGMQIMFEYSEEENTEGLGIFEGSIVKFPHQKSCPIPQMGWNQLLFTNKGKTCPLLDGVSEKSYVYYANSYYAPVSQYTLAKSQYSKPLSGIVQKNNFWGIQFHPEKSQDVGEKIFKNFISHVEKQDSEKK